MTRALMIACLTTAFLVPVGAEAAKMRFGGKSGPKPSPEASQASSRGRGLVVVPVAGRGIAETARAEDQAPARVPFPPATTTMAAPAVMQLTATGETKVWCRSETVVGGFCVLN
ncbi:hypothetical protein IP69_08125 [Bosea sp. AAP35]|uniref:hypothetical protein n=1 Tax=Bosea sp. AAP35 TaxID=1523417 RepID=UPI0006B9C50E|nr:hypothetical protein [Bosea sp. AAP35]KPF71037.1 hypothetical protein IP69_08125 [Bosea sp. AAP35]